MTFRSAQRWYAVETHVHGKGRWLRSGRKPFPSRIEAEAWARNRGFITRKEAVNGARQAIFRIVEVEDS